MVVNGLVVNRRQLRSGTCWAFPNAMQEITDATDGRSLAGLVITGHQFVKAPFDGSQAPIDRGQPGRDRVHRRGHGLAPVGRGVTAQYGVEVLGVPAQRQRERFQGAGTAAALGGVAMQLAHDRDRYLSPFGQLALPPIEIGKPRIDHSRDRRPVLLHLFLRAPP